MNVINRSQKWKRIKLKTIKQATVRPKAIMLIAPLPVNQKSIEKRSNEETTRLIIPAGRACLKFFLIVEKKSETPKECLSLARLRVTLVMPA